MSDFDITLSNTAKRVLKDVLDDFDEDKRLLKGAVLDRELEIKGKKADTLDDEVKKRIYRGKQRLIRDKFYSFKDKMLYNETLLPDFFHIKNMFMKFIGKARGGKQLHFMSFEPDFSSFTNDNKFIVIPMNGYVYNIRKLNEFEDICYCKVYFKYQNVSFWAYKLLRGEKYCVRMHCPECMAQVKRFGSDAVVDVEALNLWKEKIVTPGISYEYNVIKGGYLIRDERSYRRYEHLHEILPLNNKYLPLKKACRVYIVNFGFMFIELDILLKIAFMHSKHIVYHKILDNYYVYSDKDKMQQLKVKEGEQGVKDFY